MQNRLTPIFSRLWVRAVLFSATYFSLALLSDAISFQAASFPTFWLPSGLTVAVLLLAKTRTWSAYLLAALPASLSYSFFHEHSALYSALLVFTGLLEAATGAWLVRRFDPQAGKLTSPANVLNLVVFSALLSTALYATTSTAIQSILQQGTSFWTTWRIAWIGHGLGVLVIAPLVLSWAGLRVRDMQQISAEWLIELTILLTGLFVCALYIFVANFSLNGQSYLVVPFLVWMALRFGPRGTTLSGLVVALISAWGIATQLNEFAIQDAIIVMDVEALGGFLAVTLVTCLILTTMWDQNQRTGAALRENETRYRLLVENQGEGVGIVNADEVFTFANPAALQIFGVQSLVGRNLREFTEKQQFSIIRRQTRQRQAGLKNTYELEIVQPGGKRCNLLITATPEYDSSGKYSGTFAVFYDNTERKQAEMALRDSRARFQTLFDHSPIPIWEVDFSRVKRLLDGFQREGVEDFRDFFSQHPEQIDACKQLMRVLDANQAALQLFQFSSKEVFLAQFSKVLNRGPQDVFIESLAAISENKTAFEMEGPNDVLNGAVRYHAVRWTVAPGYEQDYRRVIQTFIDITERRQAEERMRYLSTHDVLTGIYNRNFFEAELERLQNSRMEPINVMVIDINGMKATNDSQGHAAGDELLRRTAQVLRTSFRQEDIVARIGGDEFVVLFHGSISIQSAISRVIECLDEHNLWYEGPPLSLAIGASSGRKGSLLVDLFKKADQQMYKEKMRSRKLGAGDRSDSQTGNPPQNH